MGTMEFDIYPLELLYLRHDVLMLEVRVVLCTIRTVPDAIDLAIDPVIGTIVLVLVTLDALDYSVLTHYYPFLLR